MKKPKLDVMRCDTCVFYNPTFIVDTLGTCARHNNQLTQSYNYCPQWRIDLYRGE